MHPFFRYWDGTGRDNKAILLSLYREEYYEAVEDEIRWLLKDYSVVHRYGRAHPAPCPIWRAERNLHYHGDEWDARFANRIHLFDGTGGRTRPPTGGNAIAFDHRPDQRYLGYVALRPDRHSPFVVNGKKVDIYGPAFFPRFMTLALLIPPPFMTRPRYHIITCLGGPGEGVLPFRTTPFCSPSTPQDADRPVNRAPCMHASMHSALMLKTDAYLCRPISSQDMVALVWQMDHARNARAVLAAERSSAAAEIEPAKPLYAWNRRGLSLDDAVEVLRHREVRGGAVLERITKPGPYVAATFAMDTENAAAPFAFDGRLVCLEALRCITDYLANGVPILLEVTPKPEEQYSAADSPKISEPAPDEIGHAIMVFGFRLLTDPDDPRGPMPHDNDELMRRVDMRELPSRLVVHDTVSGPYRVFPSGSLLQRAWLKSVGTPVSGSDGILDNPTASEAAANADLPGVRFVAVLPKGTQLGLQAVREFASVRLQSLQIPKGYVSQFRDTPGFDERSARYVTRLLKPYQIEQRYFVNSMGRPIAPGGVEAFDILRAVMQNLQVKFDREMKLEGHIGALHWWSVEVRAPTQSPNIADLEDEEPNWRKLPAWVFLWPVVAAPSVARFSPAITIGFAGKGLAHVAAVKYPGWSMKMAPSAGRSSDDEIRQWAEKLRSYRPTAIVRATVEWGCRDA